MDQGSGRGTVSLAALAGREARHRWRSLDPDARQVVLVVASARRVAPESLFARSRGRADCADARQLAMYLCHVGLGRPLARVARAFGRDRSTASYACAKIEDMRDDPRFDAFVTTLESRLEVGAGGPAGTEEADRAAG